MNAELKLLALDTSTELLSIAVQRGSLVHEHHGAAGAQSSRSLLPAVHDLLLQAGVALHELDAVVYGCGPGSFTGLRTTCAVAQGLAFATSMLHSEKTLPVVAVNSLLATAEDARGQYGCEKVFAALDARMGEVYCAQFAWADGVWVQECDIVAQSPADLSIPEGYVLVGNAHKVYAQEMQGAVNLDAAKDALPQASAMLRLAPELIRQGQVADAESVAPLYIRNKVALTIEERTRLKEGA